MTFNNLSVELTSFDLAKKFLLKEFFTNCRSGSLYSKIFLHKKYFLTKQHLYVVFFTIIAIIFQQIKQRFFRNIIIIAHLSL